MQGTLCFATFKGISTELTLRKDHSQLLFSYVKPLKSVSRVTVSRWVKLVLQSAGIDITKYSAHSSTATATSNAKVMGLNIAEILKSPG